jgi:hypothetical protein
MLPVTNCKTTVRLELKQLKVSSDTCSSTSLNQKHANEEMTVLAEFFRMLFV